MRTKVKAHFRKLERKKVFVRKHFRKIKGRKNYGSSGFLIRTRSGIQKDLQGDAIKLSEEDAKRLASKKFIEGDYMLILTDDEQPFTPLKEGLIPKRDYAKNPKFEFENIPQMKGKKPYKFQKKGQSLEFDIANFSSFTDLGTVSESLDKAEKEFEQKKIRETRKVEAMPIKTLPEFEKKEQAMERLEKDIRDEEQLLEKARRGLGHGQTKI